jgi:predicted ribosome-associated RNA-binding protein Tma20
MEISKHTRLELAASLTVDELEAELRRRREEEMSFGHYGGPSSFFLRQVDEHDKDGDYHVIVDSGAVATFSRGALLDIVAGITRVIG